MQLSATLEGSQELTLPPEFTKFYVEHYDFLWRCALRLGAPPAEIEDIVQDCFIVALRRFDHFDPHGRGRPSTWLFGILRNVLRNHARAARRRAARLELLSYDADDDRSPPHAEAALAGRLLDEFLATLDDDKRAAFVLGEIEGMTGPELAGALKLNLNTANSRLRAARRAFVRHFEAGEPRRGARAQLGRAAEQRAPAAAYRRGLPAIAAAAGSGAAWGTGLGALGTKLIAGLIFAAASAMAVGIVTRTDPSEAPVHAGASEPNTEPATPRASASTLAEAPAHAAASAPAADSAMAAKPPAHPPSGGAAPKPAPHKPAQSQQPRALERIADARTALLAHDPARALELVEHRRFPANLEGRRVALEIAALCQLGRRAEAQQRAQVFRAANPDDPAAAAWVDVCWSE